MEPKITTSPPGPQARAILERDSRVISQSMVREYPLVLEKARGMNLWDVDGNRYLDFTAGIAVMNLGWNHPDVVQAVKTQAEYLSHGAFLDFCSELPVTFAEKLTRFMPAGLDRVYFSNSGAESIEAAIKLARYATKRKYFISFYGGFHGRTMGALSLTAARVIQRKYFGPFLPVIHSPYANPYRPLNSSSPSCEVDVIEYMHEEIFRTEVAPDEVAAIFVEPIQGEGGYVIPPANFLRELREICDRHGILLVCDEVQTGCYRTGKFLASEHSGVVPDIVCMAKAIGGGIPMGVTIASDELMRWSPGSHASTFGGNNLACAAGLAILKHMEKPDFGSEVTKTGEYLLSKISGLSKKYEIIGDTRGIGLMSAIELVEDRITKIPAREKRNMILRRAFEHGVTFLPAGESVIRFCPPLIIQKEDIDVGISILDHCLEEIS
ncbi:MAG TPA: acetyl ornithine aminotransferase family protein [Methanoregulaceae archaeon]|nr:acetyl ornithine aminotransferase family protein [Methanoregulaceae archaeon]